MDLFMSTMKPVHKVLEDADMNKKHVDEIVLDGGFTRIPKVRQVAKEYFNAKNRSVVSILMRLYHMVLLSKLVCCLVNKIPMLLYSWMLINLPGRRDHTFKLGQSRSNGDVWCTKMNVQ